MKKGQVTIFMILAALILLAGSLAFYYISDSEKPTLIPFEAAAVTNYFEQCIKARAKSGLDLIGIQGGYFVLPENHLETDYSSIGYGYYKNQPALPSLSTIEFELENYLINSLESCVNLSNIPSFDVSVGEILPHATIKLNEVLIEAKYPITLTKGDDTINLENFRVSVPVRLGYIHSILEKIVSNTLNDRDWIDLTFLSSHDVKIDVFPNDENSIVYIVNDFEQIRPYIFLSAFEFEKNLAPRISIEDTIYLNDSEEFSLQVNVNDPENDLFTCSDDTSLFDISHDCIISFTPEIPGNYEVKILAIDSRSNRAYKIVNFEVKEK